MTSGIRKTERDYHDLAKQRGFSFVGKFPKSTQCKTEWMCNNGHTWSTRYQIIRQGFGCPFCAGNAPKMERDYRQLARKFNLVWSKIFPKNVLTKTTWKCLQGHTFDAAYHDVGAGHLCPYCAGVAKKIERDYYSLAEKRSLTWIGKFPENVGVKTLWKCKNGHVLNRTYTSVKKAKQNCPQCYMCIPKTKNDYYTLANSKGFVWLGITCPQNTNTKTLWMCSAEHKWNAPYHNVKVYGCPHCYGTARKTEDDYILLAQHRGIKWIGTFPKNVTTKTTWQCEKNHQWDAIFTNIRRGSNCPHCQNKVNGFSTSSQQIAIAEMVHGQINYPFSRKRIDIVLLDDKVAIEYDGWYWHGEQQEKDKQRIQDLIDSGWKVLSIKSDHLIPDKSDIDACLKQLDQTSYVELVLDDWGQGNVFSRQTK